MDGTPSAATGPWPAGVEDRPPRVAVVLGGPPAALGSCRVEAPDRVLRVWVLMNAAADELHQGTLPPEAAARLARQLDAIIGELERSVSPALASEMHRLIGGGTVTPTAAELRVRYASLLGWTGGLVIGILDQIEAAARTSRIAMSGS